MSTVVATYYQLQDDEILLEAAGPASTAPVRRTFTQSVGVTPAGGEGALVTWMARSIITTIPVTYKVTLNNAVLNTYTVSSIEPIAMQDATSANNVIRGDNRLVFEVTSSMGALLLSAVMLWHRVSVD